MAIHTSAWFEDDGVSRLRDDGAAEFCLELRWLPLLLPLLRSSSAFSELEESEEDKGLVGSLGSSLGTCSPAEVGTAPKLETSEVSASPDTGGFKVGLGIEKMT